MSDRFLADRVLMVEQQIQHRGLSDARLLEAFSGLPRHLFVPPSTRRESYEDCPLPIGFGQTISQPYMVALMTNALGLLGNERILEVGTGSGYQAAILARLAREVHTVELIPELSARARRVITRLHLHNIFFHVGDGSLGWPQAAPYDAIIVTAAAPAVPGPLIAQLADSGRLVIPLVAPHGYQVLKLFSSQGGRTAEQTLASVAFVPLRGRHGIPA